MISVTFNSTDERAVANLKARRNQVREAMRRAMDKLMLELLRRVQQKLSGEVLQPRKGGGGLLGSAHAEPSTAIGSLIKGRVLAGGGLTSAYAGVQEHGGTRTYDIYPGIVTGKSDKRALAFFPGGSAGSGATASIRRALYFRQGKRRGSLRPDKRQAFAGLGGIVVRHVVHPPLPERSYMRSSQEELRDHIIETLRLTLSRYTA